MSRLAEIEAWCGMHHECMYDWLRYELSDGSELCPGDVDDILLSLDEQSLNKMILATATMSPRNFAEVFFRNKPEFALNQGARSEPWRLYPGQGEAYLYDGDLLAVAGAGTGKTRMFAALGLHTLGIKQSSVLVVTHSDTARRQIFDEMVYQTRQTAFMRALFPESLQKSGQDKVIQSVDMQGIMKFVLSGEGRTVYGIHIGEAGLIICDEAALYKPKAWAAILSRARRGCRVVGGCVPYGKAGNKFDNLVQNGVPLEEMMSKSAKARKTLFAVVHWDREKQPLWDEEQKAIAIRDHGDPAGWEYKVFVRGLISDPEGKVFKDEQIEAMFVRMPSYRSLNIVWDNEKGVVKCGILIPDSGGESLHVMREDKIQVDAADSLVPQWVLDNIPSLPVDVAGVDAGRIQDKHVLLGAEDTGAGVRVRWSMVSYYVPYFVQAKILSKLLFYEDRNIFNFGVGIEAAGHNIASSIWEVAVFQEKIPTHWLSPYTWATKVALVDERGEEKRDKNFHLVKRSLKHHLTCKIRDLITLQMGDGGYIELPRAHSEMYKEFVNHSGEAVPGDFKYDEENDHFVEALRVLVGRYLDLKRISPLDRNLQAAAEEARERLTLPRSARNVR